MTGKWVSGKGRGVRGVLLTTSTEVTRRTLKWAKRGADGLGSRESRGALENIKWKHYKGIIFSCGGGRLGSR